MASFKCGIFGMLTLILIISIAAAAADNYSSSEQQLKVKFEVNLDVQTLDSEGYIAFHNNLRKTLADKYIGPTSNKVAVLPTDNGTDPQWFDLKLTGAGGAKTTVRIRVGNLYVVGYQKNGTTWYEFGDPKKGDTKHWIDRSQFLGFRGDYGELERAAGKSLTKINLNRYGFDAAVKTLATSTKRNKRAAALILVVQLVSEACRFVALSNGLSEKLLNPDPVYLKEWMPNDLERKWGTYSEILFCYYQFPTSYNFPKPTINQVVIATADKLRKILGILLNVQVDRTKCKITANDVVQNPVELAGVEFLQLRLQHSSSRLVKLLVDSVDYISTWTCYNSNKTICGLYR